MEHWADTGTVDGRLAQLRADFPARIRWTEVREQDPEAFRSAARGALLLPLAILATVAWTSLTVEIPVAVTLPGWIDGLRGLLVVALLFTALLLWIFAVALLSLPADTRRAIAIRRFGDRHGLAFQRLGAAPPPTGILFAEGPVATPSARRRGTRTGRLQPTVTSRFRAEFALTDGGTFGDPGLQLAVATYTGGKNDPKGPRGAFRYLATRMPRPLPHLMIDSLRNGRLRAVLPGTQRLSLEGDVDRHFAVYVPAGYERDALQLLTPDVLVCLLDHGRRWDVEVVEDRVFVASTRSRRRSDRTEIPALLRFAELIGAELGHQASTYTDPRAREPRTQVAAAGRRLRRRSGVWVAMAIAAAVAAMLAFPHVLGWVLDNT
ncbi:hypothetical protein IT072_02150 [Leifsonia sp. ZF2019]|uniref:hypothetical protein n=1 Tax=Leifsonia sp. ZF2019 TaxID=2781978 RepID=UPI001CBB746B|nr:hypothetical protein [Leifsonia sp. ZF2019]UAJ79904.1 hypothetical protein IT072_02150 [Leifsonia sp. ZF2019]